MENELELLNIKHGDILVMYCADAKLRYGFKKDYIVFIVSDRPIKFSCDGKVASIPTIAHVNLNDVLTVSSDNIALTIGFTISSFDPPSKLFKPTMSQYLELMTKLKMEGYVYDKATKTIHKVNGAEEK